MRGRQSGLGRSSAEEEEGEGQVEEGGGLELQNGLGEGWSGYQGREHETYLKRETQSAPQIGGGPLRPSFYPVRLSGLAD